MPLLYPILLGTSSLAAFIFTPRTAPVPETENERPNQQRLPQPNTVRLPPPPAGVLPITATILDDNVNLRAEPSPLAAVLQTLRRGTKVTIPNSNTAGTGWYGVILPNSTQGGYVSESLVGDFANVAGVAGVGRIGQAGQDLFGPVPVDYRFRPGRAIVQNQDPGARGRSPMYAAGRSEVSFIPNGYNVYLTGQGFRGPVRGVTGDWVFAIYGSTNRANCGTGNVHCGWMYVPHLRFIDTSITTPPRVTPGPISPDIQRRFPTRRLPRPRSTGTSVPVQQVNAAEAYRIYVEARDGGRFRPEVVEALRRRYVRLQAEEQALA